MYGNSILPRELRDYLCYATTVITRQEAENLPDGEFTQSRFYEYHHDRMLNMLAATGVRANLRREEGTFDTRIRMEVFVIPPEKLMEVIQMEVSRVLRALHRPDYTPMEVAK